MTQNVLLDGAKIIRSGGLVAFPTETVYGLGADATNDSAVAAIYALKGRPTFNPLIAHVYNSKMAKEYVEVTPVAQKLMDTFWPGPLTLVMKRKNNCAVSLLASAGLDTLAVRMPDHPIALELIYAANTPIVAPSANPSGCISPTSAHHVRTSFGDKAPFIIDGGCCLIGLESTVLLITNDKPVLLRYGGLSIDDIEKIIGPVIRPEKDENAPQSPGQMKSHYAPKLPIRMNVPQNDVHTNEAYLGFGNMPTANLNLSLTGNLNEAAANLFNMMHLLDNPKYSGIAVAPISKTGLGLAINDRLKRACYK